MPLPTPPRRLARASRRRPGAARSIAVACLLAVVITVTACGASGAAPHAPNVSPGGTRAYVNCLFSHMRDSGGTGARQACQSQRPAGGLGPVLRAFASCLNGHGVVLPTQSPGTTVGDALRYLNQFRSGTPTQRAAFSACLSSVR